MARSIFLTVILASAILVYVQATPVPGNYSKQLVIPNELSDPEIVQFQNSLKEIWTDVKNTLKKTCNEMAQDCLTTNTLNTLIDRIKLSVEESIEGSDENLHKNSESSKNELVDSWVDYKKKLTEQYKEEQNPNMQAIINEVETAIKKTKKIMQIAVDSARARVENAEKNNDKEVVLEYDDNGFTIKDKAQQSWKQFKENCKQLFNNPRVKNIVEKTKKMIERVKDVIKNTIESVQKESKKVSKPENSEEEEKDRETPTFKEKTQETWNDFKKKLEEKYKEMFNNSKNKNSNEKEENSMILSLVEETKKVLEDLKKLEKEMKEILNNSKPQNSEERKEDSTSSNAKTKKAVDEMKKKIVAKFNEILIKSKIKEILEKAKSNIKEIIESIKNNLGKRPKQPNDFENEKELKDEKDDSEFDVMRKNIREAWNDFKKKVDKKVKEILDYIKSKETKKKFDKRSKPENSETLKKHSEENSGSEEDSKENSGSEEDSEKNSRTPGLKDKVQKTWENSKKEFEKNPRKF
ncbi:uncharacterized protein PF11_0207-like [Vespula pensylvanica]|uniref:uncharacterized protein PF11_0207-like n=1 Tax=Vespula pensylvanica TaxID=30213 RepID=UPI001CBA326F|nr:uncharacterized protein PF11_0207-like [Vespula pensylvanica]